MGWETYYQEDLNQYKLFFTIKFYNLNWIKHGELI